MPARTRWVGSVLGGKLGGMSEMMGMEKARAQRRRSMLIHLSLFLMSMGAVLPHCFCLGDVSEVW